MDESGHKYKLLETSAITPDILLHPEYPNSLPWTTVQKKIRVLLSLLSNKNFPLQKHYGKASWDICVYCPHICHTCMKKCLFWAPGGLSTKQQEQPNVDKTKRVHWEQPEICAWARISTAAQGRIQREIHVFVKLWLNIHHCPMGNPKQSSKTSFLFRFCSNTGIFGGKAEFLVKSLEMEQLLLTWDAGRRRNYKITAWQWCSSFLRIPEMLQRPLTFHPSQMKGHISHGEGRVYPGNVTLEDNRWHLWGSSAKVAAPVPRPVPAGGQALEADVTN